MVRPLRVLRSGLAVRERPPPAAGIHVVLLGFVEKRITVEANRPLITYALTRQGAEVARMGGPFMTFLNPYAGLR